MIKPRLPITLALISLLIFSCNTITEKNTDTMQIPENFDWQGHRGCRGLMPENTIEGFIHALQFPIKTIELDVVLSSDLVVIVSHEPWFSEEICSCEGLDENNLYKLSYNEINAIDCGSKPHPRFPNQTKIKSHKPSLIDAVTAIRKHCNEQNIPLPKFNIELKSKPEWDNKYLPETRIFVERVYQAIRMLGIEEITTIQSFDPRVLNVFMTLKTELKFAFLTENNSEPLQQLLALNKMPHIYSPNYVGLTTPIVEQFQKMKIKVIPWTVNDVENMRVLINMGVDGMITDYPDLIETL